MKLHSLQMIFLLYSQRKFTQFKKVEKINNAKKKALHQKILWYLCNHARCFFFFKFIIEQHKAAFLRFCANL